MKAIKSLILITLLALTFASCSKNDYANVVPANASFVASVNFSSIAEKGDLGNSKLSEFLNDNMSVVFSAESQKQMGKYVESPKDMGIDLREPVYLFQTANHCVGIAMKMLDKGDFEDLLKELQKQNFVSKAKESDGIMMGTFLDDMQYGYDDNTILLLGSAGDAGKAIVKQTFLQLFGQDADESFCATESFARLSAEKGDITFYANMAALPENMAMSYKSLIPDGVRTSDINFVASLDFQKGRIVLSSQLVGNSDKASKLLAENGKSFRKIDGKYTNMLADDTFMWACAGVKGEQVLPLLKQDSQLKMALVALERAIDIEAMIKAVDGDFAMTLPYSSLLSGKFFHLCSAQIKNDKFLEDVDYWQKSVKDYGMSMTKMGNNVYQVTGAGEDFCWGVNGDDLFFGSKNGVSEMANKSNGSALDRYKDEIKESKMFAYIDLANAIRKFGLSSIPLSVSGFDINSLNLRSLTVRSKEMCDVEMTLELGEGKENCLKELISKMK